MTRWRKTYPPARALHRAARRPAYAQQRVMNFALGLFAVIVWYCLVVGVIVVAMSFMAKAQDHGHPPEYIELHDKFYRDWMRPDLPSASCCSSIDCAPAASRVIDGVWYARRDKDTDWRAVPEAKIERNRDSPDGRSHLCAPWGNPAVVFCFIAGSGT